MCYGVDVREHIHPVLSCCRRERRDYLTVMLPFMFIAACGVQMKSYFPCGTLAKETTYVSFGCMTNGPESSPNFWPGMFASSCALAAASVTFWNATLWGPPETMRNFTASPSSTVTLAGSNL